MTVVFRHQLTDERWLPQRLKTVPLTGPGQTIELGVHKHRSLVIDGHIMGVQIARGVAQLRDVDCIVTLVGLVRLLGIFKAPQLIQTGHPQTVVIRIQANAHAAREVTFKQTHAGIRVGANKKQLACLVGREGQADLVLPQPMSHTAGVVD